MVIVLWGVEAEAAGGRLAKNIVSIDLGNKKAVVQNAKGAPGVRIQTKVTKLDRGGLFEGGPGVEGHDRVRKRL